MGWYLKFDLDAHTTTVGNYTVNYTRAEKKTVVLDGEEQTITLYYVKPDWYCVLTDYDGGEGAMPYICDYYPVEGTSNAYTATEVEEFPSSDLYITAEGEYGQFYKLWDRDNNGEPVYVMLEPEYRDSGEITENPFTDVPSGAYYEDAVLWALNNNITNGTSATTFSPGATCTSGQVLTFLWRANGSPAAEATGTEYYATAAAWAEENGLLGKTDTAFAAGNSASRAEIVTYLYYNSVNQEG